MLIDVRPRITKPPFGAVEIDWGHPLARNLIAAWVLNEGGGVPSDTTGNTPMTTKFGSPTWTTSPSGSTISTATNADYFSPGNPAILNSMASISVAIRVKIKITATRQDFTGQWAATSRHFALTGNTLTLGGFGFYISTDGAINPGAEGATAFAIGNTVNVVGTYDQANIRVYVNGKQDGIVAQTGALFTGSTNTFRLGAGPPTQASCQGDLSYVYIWGRPLAAGETLQLVAEPYAFLRPRPAVRYWQVPAASDGVTHSVNMIA